MKKSVLQDWTTEIPMMQQTVLLTAVRGPDGLPKYGAVKMLLRWFRRCVLFSAIDGEVISEPWSHNGGSFTGPSLRSGSCDVDWEEGMDLLVDDYLQSLDAIPHHFQLHFLHASEIVGYKHPDSRIRKWWADLYVRLVRDMHLWPETMEQMDIRLGDSREGWLQHADPATVS